MYSDSPTLALAAALLREAVRLDERQARRVSFYDLLPAALRASPDAPEPHVRKLLHRLVRGHLLALRRGFRGGYRPADAMPLLTLADLCRAVLHRPDLPTPDCPLARALDRADRAALDLLSAHLLLPLLSPERAAA